MKKEELEKSWVNQSCYRLSPWEEAIGSLESIWKDNGMVNAKIGKVVLILPLELEDVLLPLIDCRIGLLRTDIPAKQYLVRVLPDENRVKTVMSCLGDEERISNCSEAV